MISICSVYRWRRTDLVSRLARRSQPAIAPPKIWKVTYRIDLGRVARRPKKVAMVIVGLRCAPDTGPVAKINSGRDIRVVRAPSRLGTSGPDAKVLYIIVSWAD